ncbi:Ectopic P granules protein 5 [Homalodisca vitripennis]|nr:Ectopic P granules protein 5 [Homalodisca vitripennis]
MINHGRGLAWNLNKHVKKYEAYGFIKPGGRAAQVLNQHNIEGEKLNSDDILVISCGTNDVGRNEGNTIIDIASKADRQLHTRHGMHFNSKGKQWLVQRICEAVARLDKEQPVLEETSLSLHGGESEEHTKPPEEEEEYNLEHSSISAQTLNSGHNGFFSQVDDYIQNLLSEFSFLPHNAPVSLVCEMVPLVNSQTGQDLREELRRAISVLFTFQRRPLRDEGFVADVRTWLGRLVAVLLRVATWHDHLFLLHHVLRCPAGVSKWATKFHTTTFSTIQLSLQQPALGPPGGVPGFYPATCASQGYVPLPGESPNIVDYCYSFIQPPSLPFNSPFSNQHLDHLVACLASILLPVQARDMFLSQVNLQTLLIIAIVSYNHLLYHSTLPLATSTWTTWWRALVLSCYLCKPGICSSPR